MPNPERRSCGAGSGPAKSVGHRGSSQGGDNCGGPTSINRYRRATALGTIGLAIATFVLAKRTKKLAESGQETADAAHREIELVQDQVAATQAQSKTAEEALGASIRHSSSMCRGRHGVGARCGPRLRSECTVVDIPMGCRRHFLLGITHDDPITYATAVDLAGEELPGSPLLL